MRFLIIPLMLALPLAGQTTTRKKSKPPATKQAIQDTPHQQIVSEWVRELIAFQDIQLKAMEEMKEGNNRMMDAIRNSTRFQLELHTSIAILKKMRLTEKPFEDLLSLVIQAYGQKIALHEDVIVIASQFMADKPKAGVDYTSLSAKLPQITAKLENIDHALFDSTVLFFGLLIDNKVNSKGNGDHLILTKAERKALSARIESAFGDTLKAKEQNYNVSAASVLHSYLIGEFKSADEPWE